MPGLDDEVISRCAHAGQDRFGEIDPEGGSGRGWALGVRDPDGAAGQFGITGPGTVIGVLRRVLRWFPFPP